MVLITVALDSSFSKMIELFSKQTGNLKLKFDSGLTPIHIDDSIVSLSAILLNDIYYDSLVKGKRTVERREKIISNIILVIKSYRSKSVKIKLKKLDTLSR